MTVLAGVGFERVAVLPGAWELMVAYKPNRPADRVPRSLYRGAGAVPGRW
ncbi:hypothetical protein ABZ793_27940 [Micromonospora sp. NPDC047465]